MRIGLLAGLLLIGLAVLYGILFVAGFPIIARATGGAYGFPAPGAGMMPGGMPMQPGQMMPRAQPNPQPNAPGTTPAPNSPQNPLPWMRPGAPRMPYGGMPMMRNWGMMGPGAQWGVFGGGLFGLWQSALACTGILVGAAAFTALGYALGRSAARVPPPAAPPGPPAEPAT